MSTRKYKEETILQKELKNTGAAGYMLKEPENPIIFSLMDRAKLSEEEVKDFKTALRDFTEYAIDVLHSVKISSMKMELIMEENKRSKNVTSDFQTTYKNLLCENEETKTDALKRLRVVEKFQKMLEEVA